jgi:hypothetical protein
METRGRKVAKRLVSNQRNLPPWLDLEPGVWEMIFEYLGNDDKREVRLVCHQFNTLASQTIKTLVVRQRGDDASPLLSLVRPPLLSHLQHSSGVGDSVPLAMLVLKPPPPPRPQTISPSSHYVMPGFKNPHLLPHAVTRRNLVSPVGCIPEHRK